MDIINRLIWLLLVLFLPLSTAQASKLSGNITVIDRCNVNGPVSLSAVDLDRDGDVDIACASDIDHTISWFENMDGRGQYRIQHTITNNARAVQSISFADLDGDGDLDLVFAARDDNKIAWLRNLDGHGYFGEHRVLTTQTLGAKSVCTADLDHDGDFDILAASERNDEIVWLRNLDGQGNFSEPILVTNDADSAQSVQVFDADHDGDLDILVFTEATPSIRYYLNLDGKGLFGQTIPVAGRFNFVKKADIDADGWDDFLASPDGLDGPIIWFHQESRGFNPIQLNTASGASVADVADLDGDGHVDIIYDGFEQLVCWDVDSAVTIGHMPTFGGVNALTHADVDGDGDNDIIAAAHAWDQIGWYANINGAGHFNDPQFFTQGPGDITSIATADVDGTGECSVITLDRSRGGELTIYKKPAVPNSEYIRQSIDRLSDPIIVCTGDLDQNGRQEIITINRTVNWNTLQYLQTIIAYHQAHAGNLFFADTLNVITGFNSWKPQGLCCIDADRDGDMDILSSSNFDWRPEYNTPDFFENQNGAGHFKKHVDFPINWQKVDIVDTTGQVLAHSRMPAYPLIWSLQQTSFAMHVVDMDNDGDLDGLLGYNTYEEEGFTGARIEWYSRSSDGSRMTMKLIQMIHRYGELQYLYPIDWDRDGDVDIMAAFERTLVWYENLDAQGAFSPAREVMDNGGGVSALQIADLDDTNASTIIFNSLQSNELILYSPEVQPSMVKTRIDKPMSFLLSPSYPNPFNPTAHIQYRLDKPGEVRIALYNMAGQLTKVIFQGQQTAGQHLIELEATGLASGAFMIVLQNNGQKQIQKCVILK